MRTLYRFIDEGQLPAYKMGRVILYPDPKGAVGNRAHEARTDDAEVGF